MFGVFCSCSYCSTLCISHSRKLSSYWCDVMSITQTVKYLLVLHTFQRPKNQVRALILEVTLSSFYLCSGKVFMCSLASKVFIIIWVRSLCACLCSQSYISFRIIFYQKCTSVPTVVKCDYILHSYRYIRFQATWVILDYRQKRAIIWNVANANTLYFLISVFVLLYIGAGLGSFVQSKAGIHCELHLQLLCCKGHFRKCSCFLRKLHFQLLLMN